MYDALKALEVNEGESSKTIFLRDIETRVLQGIVLQCLAKIEGIGLLEGNLFDSLLGRDLERVKGIYVEQGQRSGSLEIRVEINVMYGIAIPEKSKEIQIKLVEEITRWTGLHVASVHIVFKALVTSLEAASETVESESLEPAY